jgi:glycerophosphoryl diester phosphodiesterase
VVGTVGQSVFAERPTVIGHRGLGCGIVQGYEQNTLGSFLAAVECGVGWVEVDVRRTRDDVLVVAHDPAFPDGAFHVDLTGSETDRRGTLRLAELLEALPRGTGVSFDLKSAMEDARRPRHRTSAALLAPVAAREVRRRPVVVTSFDPGALTCMRELAPQVPLGLLSWHNFPAEHAVAAAAHLDVQLIAMHVGSFWPSPSTPPASIRPLDYIVSAVHESGRELMVWCPDVDCSQQLNAAGTDALIVDDVPDAVLALRGAGTGVPVPRHRS